MTQKHSSPQMEGAKESQHETTNDKRNLWITLFVATLLGLTDFFYTQHGYFTVEHLKGFYPLYGFAALMVLFLAAKITSPLLTRDESYYAPKDTVTEDYPEDQLGREKQDV